LGAQVKALLYTKGEPQFSTDSRRRKKGVASHEREGKKRGAEKARPVNRLTLVSRKEKKEGVHFPSEKKGEKSRLTSRGKVRKEDGKDPMWSHGSEGGPSSMSPREGCPIGKKEKEDRKTGQKRLF